MTLRAKTLLLISFTLLGLIVVIYGGASLFLRSSFAELESQLIIADVNRAHKAVEETVAALDRTARDYAFWDDSYAFIEGENPDYIENNFIDDTFIEFGLNLIILFDADGRPLYVRGFDLEAEAETAVTTAVVNQIQPYLSLENEGRRGILSLNGAPLLMAVRPVLPSVGPSPPNGVLLMGRYLNEAEIARLSSIVDLDISFAPVEQAPADIMSLPTEGDQPPTLVKPQDNQTVTAHSLVYDLNQEPVLLLTVVAPRAIYQQGLTSLRFLLWGLLAAGLTFGGVGLFLVERLVLARLNHLTEQVVMVGQSGDAEQRVVINGDNNDELAQLSQSINQMLSRLNEALAEQKEAEEELQQNLRETMLLNRVIAATVAIHDPHQVMELVCTELAQALDLPQAAFALLEQNGQSSKVVAEYCAPGRPSAMGVTIPLKGNPLTQAVLETRQTVYVANAQTDPSYGVMQEIARERGTVSVLVAPMIIKDKVVGTLGLNTIEEREFSAAELEMIDSVVGATSQTLENARLYASLEAELSHRKHAEEALSRAKGTAEAANIAKSEFVSVVSHELRVPLTAIQGFADLMSKGVMGPVTEAQTRHLQTIINNVTRLNNLITDLTDISKIETGRINLQFTAVNVQDLIHEALQLTEDQIKQRDHTLDLQLNGAIPAVWADRDRLMQILTNLISNAYKYTPNGGRIVIAARPTVSQLGPQGGLKAAQITVSDNGIGIRAEDQQRLFQRFFRSGDTEARQSPGTGLGLSIVKNLLEIQGGRIWFESVHGQGSSFHIIIPLMDQLTPIEREPTPAENAAS